MIRFCILVGLVKWLTLSGCIIYDPYTDDATKTKACESKKILVTECKKCCVDEQKADSYSWTVGSCVCRVLVK